MDEVNHPRRSRRVDQGRHDPTPAGETLECVRLGNRKADRGKKCRSLIIVLAPSEGQRILMTMPFSEQQLAAVILRLETKAPNACPSCGTNDWAVTAGMVLFQLYSKPPYAGTGESSIPTIPAICKNCGLTVFYNIHILGLSEVLGLPGPGEPMKSA